MPFLEIEAGITLYYEERGSGNRHIISARSRLEHAASYTGILAGMGYHVIEIQLRGYGKSTHISKDYGSGWYDIWADDVAKASGLLGVGQFVYTGMSHGDGVGWHLIRRHPEKLLAFAGVVCGPHTKDGKDIGDERKRTLECALDEEAWKAYCLERFHRDCADPPEGLSEAERAELVENAQEKYQAFLEMDRWERLISPRKPFPDIETEEGLIRELQKINLPCLFLGGMFDPISTVENMIRTGRAVRDSKTILYQDSDHGLSRRYPRRVAEDIDAFLTGRGCV